MNEKDIFTYHTLKDDIAEFLKVQGLIYLCAHCGAENAIRRLGITACPECGGEILLNLIVIPMGDDVS